MRGIKGHTPSSLVHTKRLRHGGSGYETTLPLSVVLTACILIAVYYYKGFVRGMRALIIVLIAPFPIPLYIISDGVLSQQFLVQNDEVR